MRATIAVFAGWALMTGVCAAPQPATPAATGASPSAPQTKFASLLGLLKQSKKSLQDAQAQAATDEAVARQAEARAAQTRTDSDGAAARQARAKADASKTAADLEEFKFTRAIDIDPLPWAEYLADPTMKLIQSFLSAAEQKRIDKQVGTTAASSGTTALVSKGSVPALLGLAVENGAATQETSGTTLTFRANPTGLVKAMVKHNYLASGPTEIRADGTIRDSDVWYQILNRASAAVSFDTSKGGSAGTFTGDRSQLTGYSVHYDLYNHRDPRDKKNQVAWGKLRAGAETALAGVLTTFAATIQGMDTAASTPYANWLAETKTQLLAASPDDLEATFFRRADALKTVVEGHPEVPAFIKDKVVPAANTYAASRVDLLNQIGKSPTLAFDYSNTRQVVTLGGAGSNAVTLPPGVTNGLPDLGNLMITASSPFLGTSEITLNVSATRFNGRLPGANIGRWRDFQAGVQVDVPLAEITGVGKPTLSASGLYMDLFEEPLGAKVMINGVTESRTGPIQFGQVKLDFPVGATGMHIPISMTFSNRTELIKEADVRGNIGITFDLDKIFSRL